MRFKVVLVCIALAGAFGCKKKGGGGGGWFVGEEGLMVNVTQDGVLGEGYDLGATEQLNAIACRYLDEAWVAGNNGTLLYTSDAGATWDSHDLQTEAHLRALATQDAGPVFIAGDGVFFTATPQFETGAARWTRLGDATTSFRSLAAAQRATTVLAVSDDGGIWSYADNRLDRRATIPGARAVAVSPDGTFAVVAGDGLARSFDGGLTWQPIATGGTFESVRVTDGGDVIAVGAAGTVARSDAHGNIVLRSIDNTTNLRALHVMPSGHGYAAGNGGQTWMTHDFGATWIAGPTVGRTVLGVDEIGDGHN